MTNHQMTETPALRREMHWIKVQDQQGRFHLEARWIDPTAPAVVAPASAA